MNINKKINNIKNNVKTLDIKDLDKIVIFSDCHRGDGSFKDSLYPNANIYLTALRYYYNENFIYVEAGDGDELWKFKNLDNIYLAHKDAYDILNNFKNKDRLYMIYGNHDNVKSKPKFKNIIQKLKSKKLNEFYTELKIHEGILLKFSQNKELLIFHGHQVDFFNDELAFLSEFLVRYIWGFMNGVMSFKEITSPAKSDNIREKVDNKIYKWCKENNSSAIIGHTHNTIFPDKNQANYFNIGACVLPDICTCIEIVNGTISLVKWTTMPVENGVLTIKKELISTPRLI